MITKLIISIFIAFSNGYTLFPIYNMKSSQITMNDAMRDPKAKQTAIFKAETYAEYMTRRNKNKNKNVDKKVDKKVEVKNNMTYDKYMKMRNTRGQEPDN